jgi:hypothetical protein
MCDFELEDDGKDCVTVRRAGLYDLYLIEAGLNELSGGDGPEGERIRFLQSKIADCLKAHKKIAG